MAKRYMAIWFRHLLTDWMMLRRPDLRQVPFVCVSTHRNRVVVTAASYLAEAEGVFVGMPAADAKALCMGIEVLDALPGKEPKLLRQLGLWCIRYTPFVSVDQLMACCWTFQAVRTYGAVNRGISKRSF